MTRVDFYATAAQVIPVLLIVLIFQMRYLDRLSRTGGWRRFRLFVVAVMVAGEGAAFHVLQAGHATWVERNLVVSALALLGAAIAANTYYDAPGRSRQRDQAEQLRGLHQMLDDHHEVERLRAELNQLQAKLEASEPEES